MNKKKKKHVSILITRNCLIFFYLQQIKKSEILEFYLKIFKLTGFSTHIIDLLSDS